MEAVVRGKLGLSGGYKTQARTFHDMARCSSIRAIKALLFGLLHYF